MAAGRRAAAAAAEVCCMTVAQRLQRVFCALAVLASLVVHFLRYAPAAELVHAHAVCCLGCPGVSQGTPSSSATAFDVCRIFEVLYLGTAFSIAQAVLAPIAGFTCNASVFQGRLRFLLCNSCCPRGCNITACLAFAKLQHLHIVISYTRTHSYCTCIIAAVSIKRPSLAACQASLQYVP